MPHPHFGNRLLDLLPGVEASRVRPQLEAVTLEIQSVIYRPAEDLACVYFPTTCVLSAVTIMQDGTGVEIGTIGREGMGGVQAALNVTRIPSEMVCQVRGNALMMNVHAFQTCLAALPGLRRIVFFYTQTMMNLMAQSVACNRLHSLTERCARWLLMTQDRVDGNEFFLTQEYLAYMLGVRRSGVTVAAGQLQAAGFISYRRGHMTIVNREGLESCSCECYRVVADEFERIFSLEEDAVAASRDSQSA